MPSLRDILRRSTAARELYARVDLLRKYRRLHPTRTHIAGTPYHLYADPSEKRGQALLRGHCAGQGQLKEIWRRAIGELRPTLVLDVGANYGEFVFGARLPESCRAIAIEANPRLRQWLERSRREHPAGGQITLHYVLAGDEEDGSSEFYVDPAWSGRSSAVAARSGWERMAVPTATVDSLCAGIASGPLVFKLDVEGFEAKTFRGMSGTLDRFGPIVGLAEFDAARIESTGEAVEPYLDSLLERFSVWALPSKRSPEEVHSSSADILRSGRHLDLLLASEASLAERMLTTTRQHD